MFARLLSNLSHRGSGHEAHFPAEQHLSSSYTRVSSAYVHEEWSQRPSPPAPTRPFASRRRHLDEVDLGAGFSRQLRIRKSGEYQRHRRHSKTFRTRNFVIAWAATDKGHHRLGLTVSKKVGRAHERNRVKRLLRTWFREVQAELPGSWDLVVIARPGAARLKLIEVEAEMTELAGWLTRKLGESS